MCTYMHIHCNYEFLYATLCDAYTEEKFGEAKILRKCLRDDWIPKMAKNNLDGNNFWSVFSSRSVKRIQPRRFTEVYCWRDI